MLPAVCGVMFVHTVGIGESFGDKNENTWWQLWCERICPH
jgi:hypothetical protein